MNYCSWIEEVWSNFIQNALKYGPTDGIITLGFDEVETNMIRFWVQDEGDGIPDEKRDYLFKEFIRLADGKVKGSGLGLSIIKRIMERLDGGYGVTINPTTGKNSRFYFQLKAVEHKRGR